MENDFDNQLDCGHELTVENDNPGAETDYCFFCGAEVLKEEGWEYSPESEENEDNNR